MKESYLNYHYDELKPETDWLFVVPSPNSQDLQCQIQEVGHMIWGGRHFTSRGPLESYPVSYTHLDVYKRQDRLGGRPEDGDRRGGEEWLRIRAQAPIRRHDQDRCAQTADGAAAEVPGPADGDLRRRRRAKSGLQGGMLPRADRFSLHSFGQR